MAVKRRDIDTDDLVRRQRAGESIAALARATGLTRGGVRYRLNQAGVITIGKTGARRPDILPAIVAERFSRGESVEKIAVDYGVSRGLILARLRTAGLSPRDRSQAMRLRMGALDVQERRRLASAANDARRGQRTPDSERFAKALARERAAIPAMGELLVAAILHERGITFTAQQAVGPYNIDLACGTIAVEVHRAYWKPTTPRALKRAEYLADRGWRVLWIVLEGGIAVTTAIADHVIALAKETSGNPATIREYRVVRCDGQDLASGKL